MSGDLDADIFRRETDRQRIQAEHKTERITNACIATVLIVVILAGAFLIGLSIHTPDPREIAGGTRIDCMAQ